MSLQWINVVLWLSTSGLALVAGATVYSRAKAVRRGRELEAENLELQERLRVREDELAHLAAVRLPALAESLWSSGGPGCGGLLHPQLTGSEFDRALDAVLKQFTAVTGQASERAEETATATVGSVMRPVHALSTDQRTTVMRMLKRHHDERVLADGMEIDHASNQLGRRVRSIMVLSGSWPGVQHKDTPLLEVVRGAQSQIAAYKQVRITGEPVQRVTGPVVEYVVLALAELLDNAAMYSPPDAPVFVRFVQAHHGVTVVIDDTGINMTPEVRERAGRQLSGRFPVRLTELRNPPQFGFAVIGALCARHGFTASVAADSPHGGVGATLHLPNALLLAAQPVTPEDQPPPVEAPVTVASPLPPEPSAPAPPAAPPSAPPPPSAPQPGQVPAQEGAYPVGEDGLPVRRRRRGAHRAGAPQRSAGPDSQTPTDGGRNAAAFVRGSRAARTDSTPCDDEENRP
ncbi:ATP-binding protein [Streptomyces sp. IB2014 016-6]|uniref:sensor histidine kinase n=1 Tax=Streptomyces sp. IB2014 016-6 TaxID=2517818 RepID=UPI0011CC1497|nr:ATP-binding protein [Streptomyces sp. IB2014 016-6]TXL83958.1 ATP-binding protein [Streptomyces sp. IB2014 016-6]